ncbi:MAG: type II secretion system secretin GspD [Planctomycetes bacterium]|nr:type II secretion system secretin GspD [Planctomycetota bacterium]
MKHIILGAGIAALTGGLLFGQDDRAGGGQEPRVQLNNVTLQQLLESVQRRTKKTFLYDESVAQILAQRRGRVYSSADYGSPEELFAIFQSLLQVQKERLALVPVGVAGKEIYKILMGADAIKGPVPIGEADATPNDSYVTRVFNLQYVPAQEVFAALNQMMSVPQSIVQIASSGTVIITDYDYNMKRYEDVIKAIDVKKADVVWKMIPLKKALATDVEQVLTKLLAVLLQQRQRPGFPQQQPGAFGREQVQVVADQRTNSILVLAEPDRMEEIEKLVKDLDAEPEFEASGIYFIPLKHQPAELVANTLKLLYGQPVDTRGRSPSAPGRSSSPTTPGGPGGPIGPPGGQQPQFPQAPQQPPQQGPGGPGGPGSQGGATAPPPGAIPTISQDESTNSLIVITDRNTYQMIKRFAERLDQRRPQVLIKATVVEVRASDTLDFGVELARAVDPEGRLTSFYRTNMRFSTIAPPTPGSNRIDIIPIDTPGLTLAVIKDRIGHIGALIKALRDKAIVNILDEPEVATLDNSEATITLRSRVPIATTVVTATGIAQTSFQYQDAETLLQITPQISEGGYLRLQTRINIEKFIFTSADPTVPPTISGREIMTPILVPNGRTVVIGGIVTAERTDQVTGIPVLQDIPLLGAFFRRNRNVEEKRTLYIFITPYILYDEAFGDLKNLTQMREHHLKRERGERMPGVRLETETEPDPVPRTRFRFVPE